MDIDTDKLIEEMRQHQSAGWRFTLDNNEIMPLLDRLASAERECERLRKREADLFDMLKRCERDVQRALRVANSDDVSLRQEHEALRSACEAIQQRAAGIAPPATVEESEG